MRRHARLAMQMSDIPQIFDARLRRLRRARAARGFGAFAFLAEAAARELSERLDEEGRRFERAVSVGARPVQSVNIGDVVRADLDPRLAGPGGVVFDEERVPFAEGAVDLYASVLTLHAVNDLPGALAQARRSLKPQGLFIAALFGAETLRE